MVNNMILKFKGVHPVLKIEMDIFCIDLMHDEVWFEQGTDVTYPVADCNITQKCNNGSYIKVNHE